MFRPNGKVALIVTSLWLVVTGVTRSVAHAQVQGPTDYAGVWFDDTGEGAIELQPCGSSLCGRIVWLKSPTDKAGKPLVDGYNPEATARSRPICGLPVIGGVKPQRDGGWDEGWIYDPKEGKSYDVELKLKSPSQLQVTGYLGVKLLSETMVWTRAPADLKKCG